MTITDYDLFDGTKSSIISPEEGKKLVRKSDGQEFPGELHLGFTYYLGGELLEEPHFEVPEDYEEVDLTEEELEELKKSEETKNN